MNRTALWYTVGSLVSGLIIFCASGPTPAWAAVLHLDPPESVLYRGDTETVALRLTTDEGECINAAEVVLEYDAGLRAVDVSRGNSIFSVWVVDPVINEAERTISFTGGIPGGYCGRVAGDPALTNVLVEVVMQSPGFAIGSGSDNPNQTIRVVPEKTLVLAHDGSGTAVPFTTEDAVVTLTTTPGQTLTDDWRTRVSEDAVPPADFSISLAREETAFGGQYFITFNTTDKQSGIAYYEVIEEPIADLYSFRWGEATAPWQRVESPYVLVDQTLNSTIRVRAIDKAGNQTMAVLVPDEALRSLSEGRLIFLVVVGVISVLVLVGVIAWLIRRRSRILAEYPDSTTV
jgi:hypothetical protein